MTHVDAHFLNALRDATILAPELPQADAYAAYEEIEAYERALVTPAGQPLISTITDELYQDGSAEFADEVRVYGHLGRGAVVSADHATKLYLTKRDRYGGVDTGTGGLARMLAENDGTTSVIPVGRQTRNVAVAEDDAHPIKLEIANYLPDRPGLLSVHGMRAGKLFDHGDSQKTRELNPTEVHAVIGLGQGENGQQPNARSLKAAERLVSFGEDLGLRVIIGERDKKMREYDDKTDTWAADKDGRIIETELRAHNQWMTTNFGYRLMEQTGRQFPSFQIEMTRLLRLMPADFHDGWHVDRKSRALGVYRGYLLVQTAAKIIDDVHRESVVQSSDAQ